MGRIAAWIAVGIIALAAAFIGGGLLDPFGDDSITPQSASPTTASPTAASPTTEVSPSAEVSPSPEEGDSNSYYTTDGTRPTLFPECDGAMGLCLGNPIERSEELFGTEDERFESGQPGGIVRVWNLQDIRLSVEADRIGSIRSITVVILDEPRTDPRIALPQGLVLGALTMGDVVDQLGPPIETNDFFAENVWFYEYSYFTGPEGSHVLSFTHARFGREVDTNELVDSPVTSFTASYGS